MPRKLKDFVARKEINIENRFQHPVPLKKFSHISMNFSDGNSLKEWWLTLEMESNNFPDLTMSIFYVKSQTTMISPFETCKYFFPWNRNHWTIWRLWGEWNVISWWVCPKSGKFNPSPGKETILSLHFRLLSNCLKYAISFEVGSQNSFCFVYHKHIRWQPKIL